MIFLIAVIVVLCLIFSHLMFNIFKGIFYSDEKPEPVYVPQTELEREKYNYIMTEIVGARRDIIMKCQNITELRDYIRSRDKTTEQDRADGEAIHREISTKLSIYFDFDDADILRYFNINRVIGISAGVLNLRQISKIANILLNEGRNVEYSDETIKQIIRFWV